MSNSGPAKAPTGGLSVCAAPHMQSTVYDGGQGRAGGKRKACRCAPCCLRPEIASSCRSPKVCVCHDFIMFCAVMSPLSNMHTQAPCTAHTGLVAGSTWLCVATLSGEGRESAMGIRLFAFEVVSLHKEAPSYTLSQWF